MKDGFVSISTKVYPFQYLSSHSSTGAWMPLWLKHLETLKPRACDDAVAQMYAGVTSRSCIYRDLYKRKYLSGHYIFTR